MGVLFYLFLEYATLSNIEVVGFHKPVVIVIFKFKCILYSHLTKYSAFKTLSKINFIFSVFEDAVFWLVFIFEVKGLLIALILSSIIKLFLLIVASKKTKYQQAFQ